MDRGCLQDIDDAMDATTAEPDDNEEEEEEDLPAWDESRSVLRPMRTRTVSPGRKGRGSRMYRKVPLLDRKSWSRKRPSARCSAACLPLTVW